MSRNARDTSNAGGVENLGLGPPDATCGAALKERVSAELMSKARTVTATEVGTVWRFIRRLHYVLYQQLSADELSSMPSLSSPLRLARQSRDAGRFSTVQKPVEPVPPCSRRAAALRWQQHPPPHKPDTTTRWPGQ